MVTTARCFTRATPGDGDLGTDLPILRLSKPIQPNTERTVAKSVFKIM